MDRLGKIFSKAGDVAQQANQEFQRVRQQQQQQYQQQYQQQQQQFQQQYSQYGQPPQQQRQQPQKQYGQYGQYGQQQTYNYQPPPPPPYNPPSSSSSYSSAPQQAYTHPASPYQPGSQPDLERLKREQEEASAQMLARLEADRREAERLTAELKTKMEADRQEAEQWAAHWRREHDRQREAMGMQIGREHEALRGRMEDERREAERVANEARMQMERKRQEAERLADLARRKMEEGRLEAERVAALAKTQMEADRREAERLASLANAQMEADRKEAERLAAQYQKEYERGQEEARLKAERSKREQQEEMERMMEALRVREAAERKPVLPPRPVSGVPSGSPSGQQHMGHPPPPPVRTPGIAVGVGLIPPVLSPSLSGQGQQDMSYPPPPVSSSDVGSMPSASSLGATAQQQQYASYPPPPPLQSGQISGAGPVPPIPNPGSTGQQQEQQYTDYPPPPPPSTGIKSEPPISSPGSSGQQQHQQQPYFAPPPSGPTSGVPSSGIPEVLIQGLNTDNVQHQQYTNHPPPPPPPSGVTSVEPAPSAPSPSQSAQQQQQPYFAPPPTQSTQSPSHPPMAPRAEPRVPSPQQPSSQPPPQAEQSHPSPASSTPPPYMRTPPPQEPHPCGVTPMPECIEDPTPLDLEWFTHAATPSFLVCSRCYVDHIYEAQFRDAFRITRFEDTQPRKCHFGSRRMKKGFWPAATQSGSLSEAVEFMKRRQDIPHCSQATRKEGESWYTTPYIPGATFCTACYEDSLAATSFGAKFTLETSPNACYCDSSSQYVNRMFAKHAPTNDWASFTTEVKARLQFPACERVTPVASLRRAWFTSPKGPKDFVICIACYCDFFYGTDAQDDFVQTQPDTLATACLMGCINFLIPAGQALVKKDSAIFWKALQAVDSNAYCSPNGTKGATWFTLPNDPPGFGVCGGCYAGIVESMGGTKFFVPKKGVSSDDTLLCCFSPGHIRFEAYLRKYTESFLRGTWKPLGDFAARFGSVPLCPRSNMSRGKNRRWWGWDGGLICEECYLTFAEGTSLEPQFTFRGILEECTHICTLYSPRMRNLYTETCTTNDLASYLAFAKQRMQIFLQTVPQMERLMSQQRIQMMQAQQAGMMGSFYKHLGGTLDATIGHSYTVGNSAVGYGYANEYMLDGAMYDRQASQLGAAATSPMGTYNIGMLEARWKAVE